MSGRQLVCPWCSGHFYNTNEKWDKSQLPNGSMFSMIEPYKSGQWDNFGGDASLVGDNLECPQCGGQYCNPQGFINTLPYERDTTPKLTELELAMAEFEAYEPDAPESRMVNSVEISPAAELETPISPLDDGVIDFKDAIEIEGSDKMKCPYCGKEYSSRGIISHMKSCATKHGDD